MSSSSPTRDVEENDLRKVIDALKAKRVTEEYGEKYNFRIVIRVIEAMNSRTEVEADTKMSTAKSSSSSEMLEQVQKKAEKQ